MSHPQDGDVLIRYLSEDDGYELVEAITRGHLAGPFTGFLEAVFAARGLSGTLWQEVTDERGRPLGGPVQIP